MEQALFEQLQAINHRPTPFEHYTAAELWTDPHTSTRMLAYHLDGAVDISSRKAEFIEQSVDWIIDRFELDANTRVADFGCGPGLYTTRLAAAGAQVVGIDFSERSIRHAREKAAGLGLSVDHVHADYLQYRPAGRFELITMIMCDLCALSPDQRGIMLDTYRALLKPGGALLLDVYSLRAYKAREEGTSYAPGLLEGLWSAEPYFGFLHTFKYDDHKVVLDKYTIVEATRTREIYNWLQYFDHASLSTELEEHGFVVEEILGDVAGAPYDPLAAEMAVIARRP